MTDTQSTPFVNTPEILYRLRAANGDLLYVGITRDFPSRLKQHYADKPWAYEIRSTEQVHIDGTRSQIEAIEKAVIIAEKPRYNKTHNGGVRRLTLPAPKVEVEREVIWWTEEDDGNCTYYREGDRVFTFGMVGTLLALQGEDADYVVHFDGDDKPTVVDGTCHIRHARPDDEMVVW